MSAGKRSNEPIVWILFGMGGFLVAFFLPVHVLFYGLLFPAGMVHAPSYQQTLALVRHPLARVYLFALLTFCFFHAAHRMRSTMLDVLNLRHLNTVIAFLCYGGALVGTVFTVWLLMTV